MKKIFTLFSALLMSIAIFAAAPKPKSVLTINSISHGDIRVVLDGRRFEPRDNSLMIRQLESGYHTVKVYREKRNGFYNMFGKRYEVVYSTSIMVRPRTHVKIVIDRHGRAIVEERRLNNGNGRDDRYDRDDRYGHDDRYDRNNDWNDNDDFDFDRDGKWGDYDNRNDGGFDYSRAMNAREFDQVMAAIQKEWYEGNKLKSATHIINTNFFTSIQVKQMLQLFTFENNKLDLAKLAYAKTVDQRNYLSTVDNVFSYDNSRAELARFIRNFR